MKELAHEGLGSIPGARWAWFILIAGYVVGNGLFAARLFAIDFQGFSGSAPDYWAMFDRYRGAASALIFVSLAVLLAAIASGICLRRRIGWAGVTVGIGFVFASAILDACLFMDDVLGTGV